MRLIDADEIELDSCDFDTYDDYSIAFDTIDNAPTVRTLALSVEDAEEIIAFTKMHEREEISDEMWDIAIRLQKEMEKND